MESAVQRDERIRYSPSMILTYLNEPALFLLRRRFQIRSEVGPGAWLGDAVHTGSEMALLHPQAEHDAVLSAAFAKFDERSMGEVREDITEARARVPAMLKNALDALRPLGKPIIAEGWCEAPVPGTDLVIRGKFDLQYATECIDVKTGRNCYTKPLPDHVLQLGCYWRATGLAQRILYVTEKKFGFVSVSTEDLQTAWNMACNAARAMALLESMLEPDAVKLCPPRDLTGFRWDDPTRAKARELWNL